MVISESKLIEMIKENIVSILNESNMHELYHFTDLIGLVNIIKSNAIYLRRSTSPARNGKYYMSLTRHKTDIEGYNLSNADKYYAGKVRLTLDVDKLQSIHGIDIRPYEYYNHTKEEWRNMNKHHRGSYDDEFEDAMMKGIALGSSGKNAKWMYQNLNKYNKKPFDDVPEGTPDADLLNASEDREFYNQAEESLTSDTVKYISDPLNYITHIDVYFDKQGMDNMEYGNENSFAYALCKLCLKNSVLNSKVSFYTSKNDFDRQTNPISAEDMTATVRGFNNYKAISRNGRHIRHMKPTSRHRVDPENEYWQYYGYDKEEWDDDFDEYAD